MKLKAGTGCIWHTHYVGCGCNAYRCCCGCPPPVWIEEPDGNQAATQSSGDNRGSAAQKSNPQTAPPSPEGGRASVPVREQQEQIENDHGAELIHQVASPLAETQPRLNDEPPTGAVEIALQMSRCSPCQSKRGAVIFAWQGGGVHILGRGYNHKSKWECDSSDACKASCRHDAIHAEQMALINAAKTGFMLGMEALHVKTVDGTLVASGGPSCVQCSKLLRSIGVVAVWLYHATGWRRYMIEEFHALSKAGCAQMPLSDSERETPERSAEEKPITSASLVNERRESRESETEDSGVSLLRADPSAAVSASAINH